MTIRTPTYLKSIFETADIPSGSDYSDIFDSFLPISVTGKQTLDISLEITGDFTASGNIYGANLFTNRVNANFVSASAGEFNVVNANRVSASAGFFNTLDAQVISASVANFNKIDAQIVSASTGNFNKINAQIVSASTANLDRINANLVSASGGEFNVINAQFISASSSNIKYPRWSVNSSVAAVGTATALAAPITEAMSLVKTVTSAQNDALIIGRSRPGYVQYVINDASASARIFPTSASKFNQLANGASYDIPDRTTLAIYHITSAQYYTAKLSR